MKRMTIHQRVSGTYTLLVNDGDRVSEWRTGIPDAAEAVHRAKCVCAMLGYRLDTRIRVTGTRPQPPTVRKEDTMGNSKAAVTEAAKKRNIAPVEVPAGVEKGATVRVLVEALKDKRRDQLAHVSDGSGEVVRILNGRAWVEFGNGERWWIRVDHLATTDQTAAAIVEAATEAPVDAPAPAVPEVVTDDEKREARAERKRIKERERYNRIKAEREAAKTA